MSEENREAKDHLFKCLDCESTWKVIQSGGRGDGEKTCPICDSKHVELTGGQVVFDMTSVPTPLSTAQQCRPDCRVCLDAIIRMYTANGFPSNAVVSAAVNYNAHSVGKHAGKPWIDKGSGYHIDAMMRHLVRFQTGEIVDADSGFHALSHVVLRAMMALECAIHEEAEHGTEWTAYDPENPDDDGWFDG